MSNLCGNPMASNGSPMRTACMPVRIVTNRWNLKMCMTVSSMPQCNLSSVAFIGSPATTYLAVEGHGVHLTSLTLLDLCTDILNRHEVKQKRNADANWCFLRNMKLTINLVQGPWRYNTYANHTWTTQMSSRMLSMSHFRCSLVPAT
jgi:hypothetical protein